MKIVIANPDGTETKLDGTPILSDDDQLDQEDISLDNNMQLQTIPESVHEEYDSDDDPGEYYDFEEQDNNNNNDDKIIKCTE